ncbi:hypothetical protein V8C86DRAFT_621165 [Haematococcus lacustris]
MDQIISVVHGLPCGPMQGPMQEFNCQVDPEAAKMVFDCGVALVMVPLDVSGVKHGAWRPLQPDKCGNGVQKE